MNTYDGALLWSVNPKKARRHGTSLKREETSVEKHIEVLQEKGAVYWDLARPVKEELKGPFDGYIFNVEKHVAEYKCRIDWVIESDTLVGMEQEQKYIPCFRKECLTGAEGHKKSPTWIKISKIEKLDKPLILGSFSLKKNGRPVKTPPQNFFYIEEL